MIARGSRHAQFCLRIEYCVPGILPIVGKQADVDKLTAKAKDMPVTQALGQEGKTLKTDLQSLQTSVSALTERFQVYYDTLKKKGGDVSNLK